MVITHYGEGCFRFQSGETSLLLDPVGGRLKGDVVIKTLTPTNLPEAVPGEVVFPGEYEVRGMEIQGWPVTGESTAKFVKTIYRVAWEGVRLVFLGHVTQVPDADVIEHAGDADVLVVPINGEKFFSVDAAAKLVKQLAPAYILPSFTKEPQKLAKAFGQSVAPAEKLVFKKKELVGIKERVVLLKAA